MKTIDVFSKAFADAVLRTSAPKAVRGLNDPKREHPYVFQIMASTVVTTPKGNERVTFKRTVTSYFTANSKAYEISIGISNPLDDGSVEFGTLTPVPNLQKGWAKERMKVSKTTELIDDAGIFDLHDYTVHFSYIMDLETNEVSCPIEIKTGEDWTLLQAIEDILNKHISREVSGYFKRRHKEKSSPKENEQTYTLGVQV